MNLPISAPVAISLSLPLLVVGCAGGAPEKTVGHQSFNANSYVDAMTIVVPNGQQLRMGELHYERESGAIYAKGSFLEFDQADGTYSYEVYYCDSQKAEPTMITTLDGGCRWMAEHKNTPLYGTKMVQNGSFTVVSGPGSMTYELRPNWIDVYYHNLPSGLVGAKEARALPSNLMEWIRLEPVVDRVGLPQSAADIELLVSERLGDSSYVSDDIDGVVFDEKFDLGLSISSQPQRIHVGVSGTPYGSVLSTWVDVGPDITVISDKQYLVDLDRYYRDSMALIEPILGLKNR